MTPGWRRVHIGSAQRGKGADRYQQHAGAHCETGQAGGEE
jgi:hypothetical protein